MGTYSIAETKNRLTAIVREVEAGKAVTITRHGAPVAEMVPVGTKTVSPERRAALYARMRERLERMPMAKTPAAVLIRAMRDED